MGDFVHLHLHTEWSLLNSTIKLNKLFEKALEFGYKALAITDYNNLFGWIRFYEKALEAGIKPILGCEVYVEPDFHLILLCQNETGYKNLIKLITLSYLKNPSKKPSINKSILKKYSAGLIALSGCLCGEIPRAILSGKMDLARTLAREYMRIFPGRFYLEIQENGLPEQNQVNQALAELAEDLDLPLVATNNCHYLLPEDYQAFRVLTCLQNNSSDKENQIKHFSSDKLYFTSPEEMFARFSWCPQAVENTWKIAERCNLTLKLNEYHLPRFPVPDGSSCDEFFEKVVRESLAKRIAELKKMGYTLSESQYQKRLEYEIEIIKNKGLASYFLVVADYINWARKQGIPTSPGRGKVGGSLVAFALGITQIDPLQYNLFFESFLNPKLNELPDIDVDFCENRRKEVINYIHKKYGTEQVAPIVTFTYFNARSAVRETAKVLNISASQIRKIVDFLFQKVGVTLDEVIAKEPYFKALVEKDKKIQELFAIARVIEGLPYYFSTQASGLVISDAPLIEYCPLAKTENGDVVIQFDVKALEKAGLIKFDFLSLKILTVIDYALKFIREKYGKEIDINRLPLNDPKTYELLRKGDTEGVFQMESSSIKELLIQIQPSEFKHLVALLALFRPSVLEFGIANQYINAKQNREKVWYPAPELEPILKETYGVLLYHEQVMEIAHVIAGYKLEDADILRRTLAKKETEKLSIEKDLFLKRAEEKGISKEKAKQIFNFLEKYGSYTFSKSHAVAYALLAFQSAYLKAHYPSCYREALECVS